MQDRKRERRLLPVPVWAMPTNVTGRRVQRNVEPELGVGVR